MKAGPFGLEMRRLIDSHLLNCPVINRQSSVVPNLIELAGSLQTFGFGQIFPASPDHGRWLGECGIRRSLWQRVAEDVETLGGDQQDAGRVGLLRTEYI